MLFLLKIKIIMFYKMTMKKNKKIISVFVGTKITYQCGNYLGVLKIN